MIYTFLGAIKRNFYLLNMNYSKTIIDIDLKSLLLIRNILIDGTIIRILIATFIVLFIFNKTQLLLLCFIWLGRIMTYFMCHITC